MYLRAKHLWESFPSPNQGAYMYIHVEVHRLQPTDSPRKLI